MGVDVGQGVGVGVTGGRLGEGLGEPLGKSSVSSFSGKNWLKMLGVAGLDFFGPPPKLPMKPIAVTKKIKLPSGEMPPLPPYSQRDVESS